MFVFVHVSDNQRYIILCHFLYREIDGRPKTGDQSFVMWRGDFSSPRHW